MRQTISAVVGAAGTATAQFTPRSTHTCRVSQVSIEMTSAPGSTTCALRINGKMIAPMVAQADAAGGDPPIDVQPTDALTVEWSGATAGLVGYATFFYDYLAV